MTVEEVMFDHAKAKGYRLNSSTTRNIYLFLPVRGPLKSMLILSQGFVALINVSDDFR